MTRTIIIRRDYLHYIPKYSMYCNVCHQGTFTNGGDSDRYEKRHKNLAAHVSPAFRVELGDTVTVGMPIIISIRCLFLADSEQVNADRCQKLYDSMCFGCLRARRRPSHLESFRLWSCMASSLLLCACLPKNGVYKILIGARKDRCSGCFWQ